MESPKIRIVVEDIAGNRYGEFENAKDISVTDMLPITGLLGELVFTIPKDDAKFSLLTGMKSVLSFERNGTVIKKFVYDYFRETTDNYTIWGTSYESLLMRYLVAPTNSATSTVRSFAAKKLGTEIAQILFSEAVAKTSSLLASFTVGTVQNPYTPSTVTEMTSNFEFNYESTYDAILQVALTGGADFELTNSKVFNFYRNKGSDKANVVLHLRSEGPANILGYQRDVDFRKMGNKIYAFGVGVGVNFLRSIKEDSTSQTAYGLLEKNLGMPKSLVDQAALDKLVDDQIKLVKNPPETVEPKMLSNSLELLDGWDLGDNVKIDIVDGETTIDKYMRVLGYNLAYSNSGAESVYVYLGTKKE